MQSSMKKTVRVLLANEIFIITALDDINVDLEKADLTDVD